MTAPWPIKMRLAVPIARSVSTSVHALSLALVTVIIGVAGLSGDSWPRRMVAPWIDIHVLFALLLCAVAFARYRWCVTRAGIQLDDGRGLSRHLSRIIYLVAYLVIGTKAALGILSSLWQGGTVDFNLFDAALRNGPDHAGWNPHDDFQLFIASTLLALVWARVLAFSGAVARRNRTRAPMPAGGIPRMPPRWEWQTRFRSRRA